MFDQETIKKLDTLPTPFYYYDLDVLKQTLEQLRETAEQYGFQIHYAMKANFNQRILRTIQSYGFGADCVSGNEITRAIECGFKPEDIVFAGVGKSDAEISTGLKHRIHSFNCESLQELEVIDELAEKQDTIAPVALRINPKVDAKTHRYITTGLQENKFGIYFSDLDKVIDVLADLNHVKLTGLHVHIGSQISDLQVYKNLCLRVNDIQKQLQKRRIEVEHLNLGGGLGIDYQEPDDHAIPDFKSYFDIFKQFLEPLSGQKIHFELGRAITGQCGNLISRVLYVKQGVETSFAVLDAGMTELIRPALYQAYHKIENLGRSHAERGNEGRNERALRKYDVVGPICESSDSFGKAVELPETNRGDLIAIRSAGAYGEVMVSEYNLRDRVRSYYSDEL